MTQVVEDTHDGRLVNGRVGWVLAVVTFVVAFASSYGPASYNMSLSASILASAAAACAVWLSGVRPVSALLIAVLVTVALPIVGSTFDAMTLVLVFVGFQVAVQSNFPTMVLAATIFVALVVNDVWLRLAFDESFVDPAVVYPAIWTALSVGLGAQTRKVRLQSRRLEELRDADRQRAVSDERRRIARDLHDVAAHHLSALVVRNRLARRIDDPDVLREAVEFTADTAADALDSMRHVVQVLSSDPSAPLSPQPTLADIDAVVERMEAGGLQVVRSSSDVRSAPRAVEVATVRIVQEALANVLRHRGPGLAWLTVGERSGELVVTVDDDGPTSWSPEMSERSWCRTGSYGLIGMRERAESLGGRFDVGPSAHGGWRVTAVLPVGVPMSGS